MTTDLDFARDICDDAALYYRPLDPRAAADCVVQLLADRALWNRLIARGKQVLQRFPTPEQRYRAYIDVLRGLPLPRPASAPSTANSTKSDAATPRVEKH